MVQPEMTGFVVKDPSRDCLHGGSRGSMVSKSNDRQWEAEKKLLLLAHVETEMK